MPPKSPRLLSLDVFRGLTIAGMILVNNPGSWDHIYRPLLHASGNGWNAADMVFPFFLFIVGVAIRFSIAAHEAPLSRIVRRTIVLFALGLFLNAFPFFDLAGLRIPGVLQRIALCYFAAAVIVLGVGPRGQAAFAVGLAVAYELLMHLVPVPGSGAGVVSQEGNLAAYVDRMLLGGHLFHERWDPEGILSTLPAISTTLCGVLTGHWLASAASGGRKTLGFLAAGGTAMASGELLNRWVPINKGLWTSSYVLLSAGMALVVLAACYWLVDCRGVERPFKPLVVLGANPIAVYFASVIGAAALNDWVIGPDDATLRTLLYAKLFAGWAGLRSGSLLFALAYVALWIPPMSLLYRKRIFIRV